MAFRKLSLLLLLLPGITKAQLFPTGTKLNTVRLGGYFELQYQTYLPVDIYNKTGIDSNLYTHIAYPDWRNSIHELRLDSNKLYENNYPGKQLLFDFNAQLHDSLSIYQYVFNSGKPVNPQIRSGPARIRIDSIAYEYYYNEHEEKDSLKNFFYSGNVKIADSPLGDSLSYAFRSSIIEKIITVYTTGSMRGYLSINVGPRTLSDDHERLRCIELPDGKMMKMEWWYQLSGNNYPCDYTYKLGNSEIGSKPGIFFYPNPASDYFLLQNYSGIVTLINHLGQHIMVTRTGAGVPIDIRECKSGLYQVQLENNLRLPLSIIR